MKRNTENINDLIIGCKNNDRFSQKIIFEKFSNYVMKICFSFFDSKEDAEDCLLEGFEIIFSKINTFKGKDESSFKSWIRTIIKNKCISKYREKTKNNILLPIDDYKISNNIMINPQTKIEYFDIIKIIDKIPYKNKSAFIMREIDGMKYKEIYETTGENESTIRSRVRDFKNILKKKLIEEGYDVKKK